MKILIALTILLFAKFSYACPSFNGSYECKISNSDTIAMNLDIKSIKKNNKITSYQIADNFGSNNEYTISDTWISSNTERDLFLYRTTCNNNGTLELNFLKPQDKSNNHSLDKMTITNLKDKLSVTTSSKNYVKDEVFFTTHSLECNKLTSK